MSQFLQILKEFAILFIAFEIGLFGFNRFNKFLKILFSQIFLAVINYGSTYLVLEYQRNNSLPLNNQWQFNLYTIGETLILLWAAKEYVQNKKIDQYIYIGFSLFLLSAIIQMMVGGFFSFINYAVTLGGILIVAIYLFAVFKMITLRTTKKIQPEFWACLGIIIYYACNAPYFGLIHYIQALSPELNTKLFYFITQILSNIRYLLVLVSFIIYYQRSKKELIIING